MAIFLQPFKKYADFSGRASRLEYWTSFLFFYAVAIPLVLIVYAAYCTGHVWPAAGAALLLFVFAIGTLVPYAAVSIRRLHDRGLSAWWTILWLVPYVSIVMLVLLALPGNAGDNEYGPDPKESE
jgi:uncharacterized membrane protein YhaH (DUF805 family)